MISGQIRIYTFWPSVQLSETATASAAVATATAAGTHVESIPCWKHQRAVLGVKAAAKNPKDAEARSGRSALGGVPSSLELERRWSWHQQIEWPDWLQALGSPACCAAHCVGKVRFRVPRSKFKLRSPRSTSTSWRPLSMDLWSSRDTPLQMDVEVCILLVGSTKEFAMLDNLQQRRRGNG